MGFGRLGKRAERGNPVSTILYYTIRSSSEKEGGGRKEKQTETPFSFPHPDSTKLSQVKVSTNFPGPDLTRTRSLPCSDLLASRQSESVSGKGGEGWAKYEGGERKDIKNKSPFFSFFFFLTLPV